MQGVGRKGCRQPGPRSGPHGLIVQGLDELFPHYHTAPIVEAVLDFDVATLPSTALTNIEEMGQYLGTTYTRSEPLKHGRVSRATFSDADGVAFASDDGKHLVQARLDGFSFSRLAPYDRWETFIAEAHRTWDVYADHILRGQQITGFSVRYLNEFKLEYDVPLHVYFNVYPAMPNSDTLFSTVFLMVGTATEDLPGRQLTVLAPRPIIDRLDDNGEQRVTQPQQVSDDVDRTVPTFPMILDNMFQFEADNAANAWAVMDRVRKIKNDTFNSQITDRLKEKIG